MLRALNTMFQSGFYVIIFTFLPKETIVRIKKKKRKKKTALLNNIVAKY